MRTTIARLLATCSVAVPVAAETQRTSVEVPVLAAEPIVQTVTEKIPHETCRDETVKVVQAGGAHSATPSIVGAIIGGTVGGALGNHSRYEPLILGAGAVLGASVGHDISHKNSARGYYVTEERCLVDYELRDREEVTGYRVSYRYGDTIYHTRTRTHPGDTIMLRIQIEPAS